MTQNHLQLTWHGICSSTGMNNLERIMALESKLCDYAAQTKCIFSKNTFLSNTTSAQLVKELMGNKKRAPLYFKRLFSLDNPAYELLTMQSIQRMPIGNLVTLLQQHTADIPSAALTPLLMGEQLNPTKRALIFIAKQVVVSEQQRIAEFGPYCYFHGDSFCFSYTDAYGVHATNLISNPSLAQAIRDNNYPAFRMILDIQGASTLSVGFIKYLLSVSAYDIIAQMLSDGFAKSSLTNASVLRECIGHYSKTDQRLHGIIDKIEDLVPGIVRRIRFKGDTDLLWIVCQNSWAERRFNDALYNHIAKLGCDPFRKNRFGLSSDDYRVGLRHWLTAEKKSQDKIKP